MKEDIQEAKTAFENWRQTKKSRTPIPEPLWNLATKLAKKYGHAFIAGQLNLNSSVLALKAGIATRKSIKSKSSREAKIIKVAPLDLTSTLEQSNMRRERPNKMIAEIISPCGVSIKLFSAIDSESLKALSNMIKEV